MKIIIVEGPAGAGKSTYIKDMLIKDENSTMVSSSLQSLTGSRFPGDVLGTLELALMNDVKKFYKAVLLLYTSLEIPVETVYIDRLIYSQEVYGSIRLNRKPTRPNIRMLLERSHQRLISLQSYVNQALQSNLDTPIMIHYDLELTFIVPELEELLSRRSQSTHDTGREYPTEFLDYEWYVAIAAELNQSI